ncbi:calreticulin [Anaeramoeba ignava]|uniref:Calreticulin n=1 Tax=Anaeramoeba ignava TaxID=1746090 RepID=A0A9Q0LNG5_ANAIG|nr:calreticulin [Anaeramoeba ignava]
MNNFNSFNFFSILNLILILILLFPSFSKIYFEEEFDKTWKERWISSNKTNLGRWIRSAGDWFGDPEKDKGIKTIDKEHFYQISAKFPEIIESTKNTTLVIQLIIQISDFSNCGGGYIKILPKGTNQKTLDKYSLIFGPDICEGDPKILITFNYNGKILAWKKIKPFLQNQLTHVYTLVLKPNNRYEVWIDLVKTYQGSLYEDFDFIEPKQIYNPKTRKYEQNQNYKWDPEVYIQKNLEFVAIDIWQVEPGTIYKSILIADDIEDAKKIGEERWRKTKYAEESMNERIRKDRYEVWVKEHDFLFGVEDLYSKTDLEIDSDTETEIETETKLKLNQMRKNFK